MSFSWIQARRRLLSLKVLLLQHQSIPYNYSASTLHRLSSYRCFWSRALFSDAVATSRLCFSRKVVSRFCSVASSDLSDKHLEDSDSDAGNVKVFDESSLDFTKIDLHLLPIVVLVGRPNVGKSALFNRLIRRREALVYNTPDDHVTRDLREGLAKLGNFRFNVLDSAGLEKEATSGSILDRTASMTAKLLARVQVVIFLIDARTGVHPLDMEVGKWLHKHAPDIRPVLVINKAESLCDGSGLINDVADEARGLGFGDPISMSAETGLGMTALYEALRPLLVDYMLQVLNGNDIENNGNGPSSVDEVEESKVPLQLAIVGRPNVGKSTLLNTLLQEERVMVGPEVGLTRDSVRA